MVVNSKDVSRDGTPYTRFDPNTSFKGSLEEGLMMMAKGDSAEFIVPADSFYLKSMKFNELPPGITQNDHIKAVFKLKDFVTKKEIESNQKQQKAEMEKEMKEGSGQEQPAIEKFLTENKIITRPRWGCSRRWPCGAGSSPATRCSASATCRGRSSQAGGHYLWKVDDNQPSLKEAIASAFGPAAFPPTAERLRAAEPDRARTLDPHGDRVEVRRLEATTMLNGYLDWPGVAQVCRVRSGR